jgi:G:T-mismatch repair DNA endonuclease (very short patch repair protein)
MAKENPDQFSAVFVSNVLRAGDVSRSVAFEGFSALVVVSRYVQSNSIISGFRVAVFVDGCFWHGCPKHSTVPRGNRPFWEKKLAANKARDRLVTRTLRRAGWRVVRIWEHDLAKRPGVCVNKIRAALK